MEPRWYQQEAIESALNAVAFGESPVVVLPTGSGKTIVLAGIVEEFLSKHPTKKIVILSHVAEILQQNIKTLEMWIGEIVSTYSASLGSKCTTQPVIVAGIQSIYKLILEADVGLIIVDECHLVNHKNSGMYRRFMDANMAPVVGLTATPFRLGHGLIYEDSPVFSECCYDASSFEMYNKLVDQGYLSNIISKSTELVINTSNVNIVAGEYNQGELAEVMDRDAITEQAVEEVIKYGKKYKKWLFFAVNIEHAEHIQKCLLEHNIATGIVHSKMEGDRRVELALFKSGYYRAMVNVDILTTGFDEPGIDLIAMLRPTMSPIIHVQTVGRGARVAPNKDHCLFLDFAGNTERLGPINAVQIPKKRGAKGGGEPIVKTCPECGCMFHPSVKICDGCGHEFVFKTKLQAQASATDPIKREGSKFQPPIEVKEFWADVDKVVYKIHSKPGKSDILKVQYRCGLFSYTEWVAYGRNNYAGRLARHWVRTRWTGGDLPESIGELYANRDKLLEPTRIMVDRSGEWERITDAQFH